MGVLFTDFGIEISPPIYRPAPYASKWRVFHRSTCEVVAEGSSGSYAGACEEAIHWILAQMTENSADA